MTYLVGTLVLEIKAGAPNNGRGEDNVGKVKATRVGNRVFPYVSAQAVRRWWRDSLPPGEARSPVIRSGKGAKQQAHTQGRGDLYLDDDLFGYMVAIEKKSFNRDTVLAVGTAVSVAPRQVTHDFGTMSRGFEVGADPVIHEHEHYTGDLACPVLLDLARLGTFQLEGQGNRPDLNPDAAKEARVNGAEEIDFRFGQALRLPLAERRRRAAVLWRTLAELRGGAKQALHYGERSPALVILAPVKGGNNPFTRLLRHDLGETVVALDVLRAEMRAWEDELDGPVRIGWAPGYLERQRDAAERELKDLVDSGQVVFDHPRVVLRQLAAELEGGDLDSWFEDRS
ncbi:type I-B CRISPR-associated protein Cas7/Cst2/DevR [Actinoalloteichus sp. AHMU CJ021]|uniref:CRISPR-associated protein Cst2 n=1 Tax=Actinoalloteichus caeruleus DSM 43889 TaxID=1120930 RepID=A0ABT1JEW4_ACTCY|nr:type I-B CRISPR-associated protein Cas7/Cst2/DevR [Actinoalloteichus caeruleus]AUS77232.1 type I-B CRISPR-associated protein Cas7/Cst2/DevR [Actinoalloteichus sp. AHMU CJ021]MCP2331047.1 CRISPR-associated protein Cst2 [Actinoalloteichus caeruleus DSM 43889]